MLIMSLVMFLMGNRCSEDLIRNAITTAHVITVWSCYDGKPLADVQNVIIIAAYRLQVYGAATVSHCFKAWQHS